MSEFDQALENFSRACQAAAKWKDFLGATYRTRLDTAFAIVAEQYQAACAADDEERAYLKIPPAELGRAAMLKAYHARIAGLEAERDRLLAENYAFRARAGNSNEPCVYCGLSAEDQLKCQSGFPGCSRADDQMLCRHFAAELAVIDRATAAEAERDRLARTLQALFDFVWDYARDARDIDGSDAQEKLAELGLIKLEPVRPGDEVNEWDADELYYPVPIIRAPEKTGP